MLQHLQALIWEPKFCQCGFCQVPDIWYNCKNLSRFVFLSATNRHFEERLDNDCVH